MRKLLGALAVGVLAITAYAPAAHAAPLAGVAHHRCHHGIVSEVLGYLL
ncbi:MAG TPA: hypothetical protein VGF00_17630 [Acidimicrobiia bacterium]|jgi:hypothetical protein|nr:hypothetical protein [Actinomycetota bacterium]MDQ1500553.1 hypothetical protein [Actinomycetota bacterium]MDQ1505051.1 hypothetical protein [Actinomycetota bacterium]MDQ1568775.1 hypothetical protein [Actinomycetota bacterium]